MPREERSNSAAFLTVEEAAKLIGVSPSTVRRMCDSGELFSVRDPRDKRNRRLISVEQNRGKWPPDNQYPSGDA